MFKRAEQAQEMLTEFTKVWDEFGQKLRDEGFDILGFYSINIFLPDKNKLHYMTSDWVNNIKSPDTATVLFKPILENAAELHKEQCEFVTVDGKRYCKTCAEAIEKEEE